MLKIYSITSVFTSEYRIKGSGFSGFLCPVSDVSEAEKHLESIKKKHPAATHHCYAFQLNPNAPVEFSTDDGEPGGTAGLPILNTLKSFHLMNIILIVVRYYGGTKLGKPGLADAYQTTAQKVIESAELKELIPVKKYKIRYGYSHQSQIDQLKYDFKWIELESVYLEKVTLTIGCDTAQSSRFEQVLNSQRYLFDHVEYVEDSFYIKD